MSKNKFKLLGKEDFKKTGLSTRSIIYVDNNNYVIVKNRKSRFIMKDGQALINQVSLIKKIDDKAQIKMQTNAPVCSKTTLFLNKNKVYVEPIIII